jgi:hypothetical protein
VALQLKLSLNLSFALAAGLLERHQIRCGWWRDLSSVFCVVRLYASDVDIAVSRLPLSSIGFVLSAVQLIRKNPILKLALSNALRVILQVFTRILSLCLDVQDSIAMVLDVLEAQGAALGRPYVDTIKGSDFTNMKELRVQHDGDPYRLLFAFDPNRQAVVLIGGNKRGDKRWYDVNIPIADRRFREYLEETSGGEFL